SHPPLLAYILAGLGAVLNLWSWLKLLLYFRNVPSRYPLLAKAALAAITLKIAFQVLVWIPAVGDWTFSNRNLIIGYIHLLTLGCIMPLIINQFIQKGLFPLKAVSILNYFLLFGIAVYLFLLFMQPALALLRIAIPSFPVWMLSVSVFLLLLGVLYLKYRKSP